MMDNPATDPAEGWRRCAIGRARSPVKATIASNGRLSLGEDCSASTRDLHGCTKFLIYNSGKNLKKGWQGLTTSGFSSWAKFSPLHPTAASDNWFKAWVTIPSQSPLMAGGTAPPHLPCWWRSSQRAKSPRTFTPTLSHL